MYFVIVEGVLGGRIGEHHYWIGLLSCLGLVVNNNNEYHSTLVIQHSVVRYIIGLKVYEFIVRLFELCTTLCCQNVYLLLLTLTYRSISNTTMLEC